MESKFENTWDFWICKNGVQRALSGIFRLTKRRNETDMVKAKTDKELLGHELTRNEIVDLNEYIAKLVGMGLTLTSLKAVVRNSPLGRKIKNLEYVRRQYLLHQKCRTEAGDARTLKYYRYDMTTVNQIKNIILETVKRGGANAEIFSQLQNKGLGELYTRKNIAFQAAAARRLVSGQPVYKSWFFKDSDENQIREV